MSSEKKAKVEHLAFGGKGKPKAAKDDSTIIATVRSDHGYPRLMFPKSFIAAGMKLNQEVIVERKGSNPLNWEITIKPLNNKNKKATALQTHSK